MSSALSCAMMASWLTSVTGTDTYVNSISYDAAGRATKRILGNGVQSLFTYNAWTTQGGRLQSIQSGTAAIPAALQSLTYAYDPVGNVSSITDGVTGQAQTFSYDALDRLTSANASADSLPPDDPSHDPGYPAESYGYDAATGNLSSKAGVTMTYGNSAHKHAVSSTSSGNTYTYDADGNMITRHTASGDVTMDYDAEGHLVTVSGPNGYGANFVYDGDGNRVMSDENGKKTVFVGGIYETEQIGSAEAVITKYYFAGSQRIVMRKDGALTYLLTNQLGSTSLAVDASGVKTAEMRYKPWGEVRYSSGTLPTEYTHTDQFS